MKIRYHLNNNKIKLLGLIALKEHRMKLINQLKPL
jgi:hypothetical protein